MFLAETKKRARPVSEGGGTMKVAAIVPSLNPDHEFIGVVDGLIGAGFTRIIAVNDGSGPEYDTFFEQVAEKPGCTVMRHEENKGKGRALKTAFEHYLEDPGDCVGVITLDADGQHSIEDVTACARALEEHPEDLVLGVRDFDLANVPQRSAMGNKITRRIIKRLFKLEISDTQTGLRGISNRFAQYLLRIKGERYEFETLMLLETKRTNIDIFEVPIHTIYIDDNSASHFRTVADSVRIYKLIIRFLAIYYFFRLLSLIKFAVSSISSAVLDIGLFALLDYLLREMPPETRYLAAVAGARVCSSVFNFFLNKLLVFQSRENTPVAMVKYASLTVVQLFCSYVGIYLLSGLLPLPSVPAKILVDVGLFFASYFIQRKWVFHHTAVDKVPTAEQIAARLEERRSQKGKDVDEERMTG